ncbi:histidine--tRNA ligase [Bacteroidia bacterium]|nr:histidine--tRNA ligase [Bacteroidia bacterium]
MRDYSPEVMLKRNFIYNTLKEVFRRYGYQPLETPAMENLSTLMGKYGEEGDKLLFKVLNSGDFLSKVPPADLSSGGSTKLSNKISEKGLRYDLTVPFARYVVQHRDGLTFPFKRYQIQPVWRADRPQKGRYREFVQCDVDVIGSNSLLNEVELLKIVSEVYKRLNIRVRIHINNRKVLAGIAEIIGAEEHLTDITVAIDKMDKIGLESVNAELKEKGLSPVSIQKLQPVLALEGDNAEKLRCLQELFTNGSSATGLLGVEELRLVFDYLQDMPTLSEIKLDLTLARGLSYYTGAIFEVKALDVEMGSITGGGRYDDLTGIFGLPGVSGVGISFGADRIFDVMEQLNIFSTKANITTQLLLVNFGKEGERHSLKIADELRAAGISVELYPEAEKLKKQIAYADKKGIPYVGLIGENEIKSGLISVKDMKEGSQKDYTLSDLTNQLSAGGSDFFPYQT